MNMLLRTVGLLVALPTSVATLGCGDPVPEGSFRVVVGETASDEAGIEKELTVETSAPAVYFALGLGDPQKGLTGLSGDLDVGRPLRVFATELPKREIQVGFGHGGSSSEGPLPLPEGVEFHDAVTFTGRAGTYKFGETILIGHAAGHEITLTVDNTPDGVLRGYAGID